MMSGDLKFDKMDVDTTLATQYLKVNKEIHGTEDGIDIVFDSAKNKIFLTKPNDKPLSCTSLNKDMYLDTLWELSEKLQCNIDLFCQLEYVIRRRSPNETKLDLEMIIKNLRNADFVSSCWTSSDANSRIAMNNDSPLIDLGWIAELRAGQIVASPDVAVVCSLFTKLCHECELPMSLLIVKDPNVHDSFTSIKNKKALRGCIGVVTAKCDVASSVDIILSAPKSDVWGFRRILVQESISDIFKQAMAWKAKPNDDPTVKKLQHSCTDLFTHDGKVYVHEYVKADSPKDVIFIECFRTVKEAIGMVESYEPFCVSLWCRDVAESNEIALGTTAPFVWINGYGNIGEPVEISEAYYSYFPELATTPELEELSKSQKCWAKLTRKERALKLCELYKEDFSTRVKQRLASNKNSDENFVHVDSSSIVTGIRILRDICVLRLDEYNETVTDIWKELIEGSGYLVSLAESHSSDKFIKALLTSEIPIRELKGQCPLISRYTRRVIHTNFGTIFAN